MNAAHMIRRFEAGGFNRDQATCLAETIADEVETTVATREFVELAIERATSRLATAEEVAALARDIATRADLERMATKADVRDMATKADIRDMATKADLERMATKADLERMATKADIRDMATKADLERMATKDDLNGMATEEFVERVVAQATAQMMSRMNEQTRWFAGVVIIQTVAILTAAVTITRVLG